MWRKQCHDAKSTFPPKDVSFHVPKVESWMHDEQILNGNVLWYKKKPGQEGLDFWYWCSHFFLKLGLLLAILVHSLHRGAKSHYQQSFLSPRVRFLQQSCWKVWSDLFSHVFDKQNTAPIRHFKQKETEFRQLFDTKLLNHVGSRSCKCLLRGAVGCCRKTSVWLLNCYTLLFQCLHHCQKDF